MKPYIIKWRNAALVALATVFSSVCLQSATQCWTKTPNNDECQERTSSWSGRVITWTKTAPCSGSPTFEWCKTATTGSSSCAADPSSLVQCTTCTSTSNTGTVPPQNSPWSCAPCDGNSPWFSTKKTLSGSCGG